MFSGKLRLSEDEEDFLGNLESTRSNLSNIFGVSLNQEQPQIEDHSLKYVPPKETKPIKNDSNTVNSTTWSIQVAKVVSAFKLVNNENVSQGKVGLAVLKSKEEQFKIILYRTKNRVLSTFTMNENTKVFMKNSYLQFRDDLQVFWSILFENTDLHEIFEFIKEKVIIEENNENSSDPSKEQEHKEILPSTDNETILGENSADERSKETKAQILSRMAKMGKPLPRMTTTTTDLSDSSDTEIKTWLPPKPVAVPRKPKGQQIVNLLSNTQLMPVSQAMTTYNPNINVEAQYLNMLMTENRTQNAEVRINMSKLDTKIEKVLDKIDLINSKESKDNLKCKDDEILELEEKNLLLKKENRMLKVKIKDFEEQISSKPKEGSFKEDDIVGFNHSIELLNINKEDFSTSNDLLKEIIRKYEDHCATLGSSIDSYKKTCEDYENQIQSIKQEKEDQFSKVSRENMELKASITDMEEELKQQTKNQELVAKKDQIELLTEKKIDSVLKDIMNNLYQNLVGKFEEDKIFSYMEILRICGSAIKQETNNAIKKKNYN